jgi:hypothetical protein
VRFSSEAPYALAEWVQQRCTLPVATGGDNVIEGESVPLSSTSAQRVVWLERARHE